ncbi:hypothetical protein SAMN05421837_110257 [Amycolatopsis pretoriensis]|uniref:CD-NTase-associated protein 16 NUDIX domain-containing protein n=1 Tax=Amycolatopsis pretoriensis TaxID=218821 RepID=A0A1H5RDP9_9PSEU|nr:hypothetical protein [Amycolatopsis pretoriensis]SEF36502.1 hypothetical protein SAMN05421837_110257 [Amycolatopsis pretoriensis]
MTFSAGFRTGKRRHLVRVSCSVLLRLADDDRYVLFDSPKRPGAYGPPGGVIKIHPPAAGLLESWGFQPERTTVGAEKMRADLRGTLPAGALRPFQAWFATNSYRETAGECLLRELREELSEVGLGALEPLTRSLVFSPVRTVREGPAPVPGKPYLQVRNFEVYDLALLSPDALRLRRELVDAGHDESRPGAICANFGDIAHGRLRAALIAPHSAFLAGPERLAADLPPVR